MTTIPTISQLTASVLADLQAEYGTNIPLFGKVFLRVLAVVQAGKLKLLYLFLGDIQKNVFIDTADTEKSGGTLERFGRTKLGRDPFPAKAGQYTCSVTGLIGSIISAGTTFKSNDDALSPGKLFVLDTAYTLVSTTDSIILRALEGGIDSKLLVDDQLTATQPLLNIDQVSIVTVETIQPLAAEDIEDYRTKGLEAYRLEAQGGASSDYRIWANDAQGVKTVYAYAKSGESAIVDVYVEATIADSTDGKGTPSPAILADVEAVVEFDPDTTKPLNERGRRPLGAFDVNYIPVTIKQIDITINGFVGITAGLQTLIFDAIKAQLDATRPFVAGADVLADKKDIFDLNSIIAIILNVKPGSVFGSITLEVDSVSVSTYTFNLGNIPYLNVISYT